MNAILVANSFFGAGAGALIAKATAVLLAAALATLLLPRASAAVRHLVWLTALAGCAALTLLSPVAPPLFVPLPTTDERPIMVDQITPHVIAVSEDGAVSVGSYAASPARATRAFARPSAVRRSSFAIGIERYAGTLLVAMWLIGCVIVLARCVLGHLAIARIILRARRLTSPIWNASLDAAMVDAGARRTVDLLISDKLSAPVTTGFLHPVVLLPPGAESWSEERRRVVLVHEIAHIVRFDYVSQLVATLAGAFFWFHPLAWLASARLRAEAENAADDRVLVAGTAGVAYAGHLLELARQESGMPLNPAVAVGMVRASTLERRFRAMLDTTRSRAALPRRLPAVATSLTLAAMIPLAGARTTIVPLSRAQGVVVDGQAQAVTVISTNGASATAIAMAEPVAAAIASRALGDSTIDKTIDATAGGRLTLDLTAGGSVVVHGWDEPHIRMRATLGGRDWRDVRVTLESTKGGARLQSGFSEATRSWSTDNAFELWVPRHMDIDLSSAGGSLAISDLTGDFRGHTGGGAITIERASGMATLTTGGGDVSVTNSSLGGTVSTGGGGVYISNVSGGLRGSSGSGPVISDGSASSTGWRASYGSSSATAVSGGMGGGTTVSTTSVNTSDGVGGGVGVGRGMGYDTLRVFGSGTTVAGRLARTVGRGATVETTTNYTDVRGGVVRSGVSGLTYTSVGGDVVLDEMPNGGRVTTGGGRISIASSGGFVSLSTGGGDVELAHMGGDATVWTGSGTVTITVVNTDGTEHSIDVSSGSGRVVLELPRDLDATIDLESAYTENFRRKTSIESELALTQSETQTWDDHNGTPRKYVRARGTVGNGRGLIRVRTVNGDIIVRRR